MSVARPSIFFLSIILLANSLYAYPMDCASLRKQAAAEGAYRDKLAAQQTRTGVSRRKFLQQAGASAIGAGSLGTGALGAAQEEHGAKFENVAEAVKARFDRIKNEVPGGKVASYSWDISALTPGNVRALGEAGFNEIVIDGYGLLRKSPNMRVVKNAILEAHKWGIEIKFTMGHANWAYGQQEFAKKIITELCKLIDRMKKALAGDPKASGAETMLKGLVIDIEPYTAKEWDGDFASFIAIHNELKKITEENGLSYERCEAFWFAQSRTEDGKRLVNYQFSQSGRCYMMSYRDTGSGTVAVSRQLGDKVEHLIGFDMTTRFPTGFMAHFGKLPSAITEAVDISLSEGKTSKFRGMFVHSSSIADLVTQIRMWKQTKVKPGEFIPAAPKKETPVPEQGAVPDRQIMEGKPGLAVTVLRKDADVTRFQVAITLPEGISREDVMLLAFKRTDLWYLQGTFADIPANGIINVNVLKRRAEGQVRFVLVDKKKYEKLPAAAKEPQLQSLNQLRRATVFESMEDLRAAMPPMRLQIMADMANDMAKAALAGTIAIPTRSVLSGI